MPRLSPSVRRLSETFRRFSFVAEGSGYTSETIGEGDEHEDLDLFGSSGKKKKGKRVR